MAIEKALFEVKDTVEGYGASLIIYEHAKKLNLNLKLLDYLISIYEQPKDLSEDKKIFNSVGIDADINFKFK